MPTKTISPKLVQAPGKNPGQVQKQASGRWTLTPLLKPKGDSKQTENLPRAWCQLSTLLKGLTIQPSDAARWGNQTPPDWLPVTKSNVPALLEQGQHMRKQPFRLDHLALRHRRHGGMAVRKRRGGGTRQRAAVLMPCFTIPPTWRAGWELCRWHGTTSSTGGGAKCFASSYDSSKYWRHSGGAGRRSELQPALSLCGELGWES